VASGQQASLQFAVATVSFFEIARNKLSKFNFFPHCGSVSNSAIKVTWFEQIDHWKTFRDCLSLFSPSSVSLVYQTHMFLRLGIRKSDSMQLSVIIDCTTFTLVLLRKRELSLTRAGPSCERTLSETRRPPILQYSLLRLST